MSDLDTTRVTALVTNIRYAAKDTHLFTFERPDGGPLPPAEPGAHIGLHLPNGLERHYSLVIADEHPTSYTVGIKRDAASRGGSVWIHDHLRVGMTLPITLPRNNFPLQPDAAKTVLFAGGIGITPIYCMASTLRRLGRDVELHYSCRSRADMAFLKELAGQPGMHLHFADEGPSPFLPIGEIIAKAPKGTHFYCCGPGPMLAAFEAAGAADGRPAEEIHVEYFTPKYAVDTSGGFTVELARSRREFQVPEGKTILTVLLEAGLDIPYSCEEGICGSCETKVLSGTPDHRDALLTEAEKTASKTMMICCSGAKSPRLVLDL
jgi:ferredoxin-NADP reductase